MSNKYYRDWERSQSSNSYSNVSPQTYLSQVQNHIIGEIERANTGTRSNSIFALSGIPIALSGIPVVVGVQQPLIVQHGPQIIIFR